MSEWRMGLVSVILNYLLNEAKHKLILDQMLPHKLGSRNEYTDMATEV